MVTRKPPRDWMPTITAVAITIGLLAQIVLQVMTQVEARATARAAAAKTEQVREALEVVDSKTEVRLDDLKKTGEATHVLVNSSMSAQLKISMIALKRVAELTNNPEDVAAAELAEKLLKEHDAKQAKVDAKEN